MTLVERILSGFKIDLFSKVIRNVSGGLLAVVLARLLTPEEYGLLYLSISLFTIITLLGTFGIGGSAARYITEYEERDSKQIRRIIETTAAFLMITLTVVAIALVFSRNILISALGESAIEPLLLIGVIYVVTKGITDSGRRICQGFKQIKWAAYVEIVQALVRLTVAITLAYIGFGAVGALAGYVVASIIGVTLIIVVIGYLYLQSPSGGTIEAGLRRRIAEYALPLAMTSSSDTVIKRVDILLIGVFLNPLAVSFYIVGKQITTVLKSPANSLGFAISPRFSEQIEKGNLEIASRLYAEALTGTVLFYLPAMVGLVIVAEPTLAIVFGPEYVGGTVVLQILTIYLFVQAISYITGGGLNYLGRAKHRAYAKVGIAVGNFGLNLVLIPTIGIIGAAISTAGAYVVYVAYNIYLIHIELEIDWWKILGRTTKIVGITGVMTLIIYPISTNITGPITLIGVVAIGVGVWLAGCLWSGLIELKQILSAVPLPSVLETSR